MIHLFIDTNRYLALYGFPKEKLDEISKIIELIKKQKIILYVPEQVENEFYRNREEYLIGILKRIDTIKFDNKNEDLPNIPESEDYLKEIVKNKNGIKQNYKEINAIAEKVKDDFCKKIKNKSFKVDEIISNFFELAKKTPHDEEIHERAFRRIKLGNPPGKGGSNGDAVIWESLLKDVPDKTDLFFVGFDNDFKSKLDKTAFSPYLLTEWKSMKKASIIPFNSLGEFIKAKIPEIKHPNEIISKEGEINNEFLLSNDAIYRAARNYLTHESIEAAYKALGSSGVLAEWFNKIKEQYSAVEQLNNIRNANKLSEEQLEILRNLYHPRFLQDDNIIKKESKDDKEGNKKKKSDNK